MSRELDERDVKKIVEKEIEEIFGSLGKTKMAMHERYQQHPQPVYGLMNRIVDYIQELESRIEELEERLSMR